MGGDSASVRLRVLCVRPPDPRSVHAEFGIQKGEPGPGPQTWVMEPGHRGKNGVVVFECQVNARRSARTKAPNLLGPCVYGPPGGRFLYLSWRQKLPDGAHSCRRLKVELSSIAWGQIERASRPGKVLEAAVPGTARDGGLACGTVELLGGGWAVRAE